MITQLQTPIPIETPKGRAWAVAIIDYGPQWDLQWISFVHATGECWTFRNSQIRQGSNYTFGLSDPTPIGRPSISKGKAAFRSSLSGHNGAKHEAADRIFLAADSDAVINGIGTVS